MLQEVNNLRYIEPLTGEECKLTAEQRTLLLDKLSKKDKIEFGDIRKSLGFLETVKFNLESGHRKNLWGHPTDAALANKNIFGKDWYGKSNADRDAIVRDVLELDDRELLERAKSEWGLSKEAAERLASLQLPEGYLHLSRVALEKLLPHVDAQDCC